MAIETRIPKEITEYREKLVFGLSIRQLASFGAAVALAVGSFLLLTFVFHVDYQIAGYIVMFEAAPLVAVGFVRIKGYTLEKYAGLYLRYHFGPAKRTYQTELPIDRGTEQERKRKYVRIAKKAADTGEYPGGLILSQRSYRAKRKVALRKIKKAKREQRIARKQVAKTSESGAADHPLPPHD